MDELTTRLAMLEGQAGPWQAMALEQAAGLALRAGDRKTALTKYTTLAGLSDIPPGVRQRANQMLKILNDRSRNVMLGNPSMSWESLDW